MTRTERLEALAVVFPGPWTPDRDGCPTSELAATRYVSIYRDADWSPEFWVSGSHDRDRLVDETASHGDGAWSPFIVYDLDEACVLAVSR